MNFLRTKMHTEYLIPRTKTELCSWKKTEKDLKIILKLLISYRVDNIIRLHKK